MHLGGTGISPQDSFSYRSNFRFRSSFRSRSSFSFSFSFSFRSRYRSNFRFCSSFRSRSSSSSTTSGDIFYCSGSRQLNHSSFYFVLLLSVFSLSAIMILILVCTNCYICCVYSITQSTTTKRNMKGLAWALLRSDARYTSSGFTNNAVTVSRRQRVLVVVTCVLHRRDSWSSPERGPNTATAASPFKDLVSGTVFLLS